MQILNPIINEIANQGETLKQLQTILNKFPDNPQITDLNTQLTGLAEVYSRIEAEAADGGEEDVNQPGEGSSELSMTPEQLQEVTEMVERIRSDMVQ